MDNFVIKEAQRWIVQFGATYSFLEAYILSDFNSPTSCPIHFIDKLCLLNVCSTSVSSCFQSSSGVLSNALVQDACHKRLGHPFVKVLHQNLKNCNEKYSMNEKPYFCDACQFGKTHALPFKQAETHSKAPLDLIYFDIWDINITFTFLMIILNSHGSILLNINPKLKMFPFGSKVVQKIDLKQRLKHFKVIQEENIDLLFPC